MKKVVAVTAAIVLIILALSAAITYSNENISKLRSIPSQYRYAMEIDTYETEVLDAMIAVASQKDVDIVRQVSYYDYESNKSVVTDYVYTTSEYGKKCTLTEGRMLNSSDMEHSDTFLSTIQTNEQNQLGVVYGFNKSTAFYIRPLLSLSQKYETKGTYNLLVSSQADAEAFAIELLKYIDREYDIAFGMEDYSIIMNSTFQGIDDNLSSILLYIKIVAFFALFLIIAFSCVFLNKEIAVLKTAGYSSGKSVSHAILRSLSRSIAVVFILIIAGLFVVDSFQVYLVTELLPTLVAYAVLEFLTAAIVYNGYAMTIKLTYAVKGKAPLRIVGVANLAFYVLTSIICVAVLNATVVNIGKVNIRTAGLADWTEIQDYGVFFPVSSGLDQNAIRQGEYPLDVPSYEFFRFASANEDAIYIQTSSFVEEIDRLNTDILCRIMVCNTNYLLKFPIMDVNGNIVKVEDSEEETVYLIKEMYKQREDEFVEVLTSDRVSFHDNLHVDLYGYEERPLARKIKIIYVADDQEFFSINPDVAPGNHNLISDAIVQVITESNCLVPDINLFNSRPYLFIPLNGLSPAEKKAALMEELKKNSLDDNLINFVIPNTIIRQEIDELRVQTRALLAVAGIFTLLMIITISQAIASLFRINEYRCFVLLSLGRSRAERWRRIIIPLAIAQIIILLAGYAITRQHGIGLLLIVQILEVTFAFALMAVGEKKNIIKVLKKGA